MELVILSKTLNSYDSQKLFNIDDICKLAKNLYPNDFEEQENLYLKYQLEHYELDIRRYTGL